MNTTSNIAAIQSSGVGNTPQSQSQSQSPQGLLGFLDAILQQMKAAQPGSGPAQISAADMKDLAEKIAALLKKNGISADTIQSMSPQDLATKITSLLQQSNITLPVSLQNLSPQDLSAQIASAIQTNNASASGVKPSLTSDLAAPQTSDIQSGDIQSGQTKNDVAKKISDLLENQQQSGSAFTPALFHQLKDLVAQLQSAPGTLSQDALSKLTTDMSSFLSSQGVSQSSITNFIADLSKSAQNDISTTTNPTTTNSATASADAKQSDGLQQPQTNTGLPQANTTASASQITDAALNTPPAFKGIIPQGYKPPTAPTVGATTGNIASQISAALTQQSQQQASSVSQQDLTAKISGISVNPALINDLANNGSNSGGFGSDGGFNSQGNNTQQQDPASAASLLQPATADMLYNRNFSNYLTSASSDASPTTQMVSLQMQRNINSGINTMTLQLEPAGLGKLDVKLQFSKDGTVKAHMTVDKPETLALLQKDSHHLQRALQQSGIETDENSLSFDLRQQGQQQNMDGFKGNSNADKFAANMDNTDTQNTLQAQIAIQASGYITPSGVNIMV